MRAREALLLLLLLMVAAMFRGEVRALAHALPASSGPADHSGPGLWRYAAHAPYYSVVPPDVRQFRSSLPHEAAAKVCSAMGGAVGFVQPPAPSRHALAFTCRFEEPDMTISAEFGELRRIPRRAE